MATVQEVVRKLTIVSSERGVDETAAKLRGLGAAHGAVTVENQKSERATLSMERRLASIQKRYDAAYRQQQEVARVTRDLNAARAQGLITMDRQNEILGLQAASFDKTAAAANRLSAGLKFVTGFAAGFVIGGVMRLPSLIGDIIGEAAGLVDTAQKIGVSTKALQELHFAAGQTGVEIGEMDAALSFFSRQLGEASRGAGDLLKILEANNVALRDQHGQMRPVTDLLADYADLVAFGGSSVEKATLVTKAFGRANDELVNTLSGGSAGLRDFAAEADSLGIVSDDLLQSAAALDDEFAKLTQTIGTGLKTAVLQGATVLSGYATQMTNLGTAAQDLADNPSWASFLRFMAGDYAGAVGEFLGAPINQVNRAGKGDFLGVTPGVVTSPTTVLPNEAAAKASREAATEAKRQQDAIDRVNGSLQFQMEQLGRTAREQAIYNSLNQAGVDINSAAGEKIATAAGKLYDQQKAVDALKNSLGEARDFAEGFATGLVEGLKAGASLAGALIKATALPVANDNTKGSSDERARRPAAA